MEDFEFYLENESVRKVSVDLPRAKFLVEDGKQRISDVLSLSLKKLPKIIFENFYDALRDFCDAILLINGFKSYSHEASIIYLLKKNFSVAQVNQLDNFRFKRNGSKYYGKKILVEDAKEIIDFYSEVKTKFETIFKENLHE